MLKHVKQTLSAFVYPNDDNPERWREHSLQTTKLWKIKKKMRMREKNRKNQENCLTKKLCKTK